MYLLLAILLLLILILYKKREGFSLFNQSQEKCICVVISDEKTFKEWSEPRLKKLGLPYERSDPVYTKETTYGSTGETGCVMAHQNVWKKAATRSIPTLVLERDWEINPDITYSELYDEIMDAVNSKEDMIRLGYCTYGTSKLCTHAYLIKPNTASIMTDLVIKRPLDYTFSEVCNSGNITCGYRGGHLSTPYHLFGEGVILQDRKQIEGMRDHNNKKTTLFNI